MNYKKTYIKRKTRRKEEFQFFMHDFVDACCEAGMESKPDIFPSYRWHIRGAVRNFVLWLYRKIHTYCPGLIRRRQALLIASDANTIFDIAFPYYGSYEIVPMLWDSWPAKWEWMCKNFAWFDIKTVLVSSSQVAERINTETNVRAYWIPEGINAKLYHKGTALSERHSDVLEMGRRMERYHVVIADLLDKGQIHGYNKSNMTSGGTLDSSHVRFTNEELYALMADSKVMVCFPQCDTNPQRAGDIETLTQRYWEAMLSRCVMIGRCPQELIAVIGYNPVVEVDWGHPDEQLLHILHHPGDYQPLVDKNYDVACKHASWQSRMPLIRKVLSESGYEW